jgi:hypothetical protein
MLTFPTDASSYGQRNLSPTVSNQRYQPMHIHRKFHVKIIPLLSAFGAFIKCTFTPLGGPGSSVGIATGYGLDVPGIESRWGARFSVSVQTGPGVHPDSCTMGTRVFLGVKRCDADPSPPSSAVGHERVELYLYSPVGLMACTEPQ